MKRTRTYTIRLAKPLRVVSINGKNTAEVTQLVVTVMGEDPCPGERCDSRHVQNQGWRAVRPVWAGRPVLEKPALIAPLGRLREILDMLGGGFSELHVLADFQ